MGYLTDNIGNNKVGDAPVLYPYEMIVEWGVNDLFTAPRPIDQLLALIKETLPDIETWNLSILRGDENRAKFRFNSEAIRGQASDALLVIPPGAIFIKQVRFQNPPDRATRGIA